MALAEYSDVYWFPDGTLARNIPARIFPEHSNEFATLYADASGTTELPNPLNTDNDGRLHFWVEAGLYWISIDQESIRVPVGTTEVGVTPQQVDEKIAVHNADTTDVHGIPNTGDLVTSADIEDLATDEDVAAVQADLDAHEADTTAVHGIPDTAALETQAGAQAKADAAEAAAEAAASADAQGKVEEARGELEEAITAGDQASAAALAAHAALTTNVHGIPDTANIPTNAQFQQVQAELAAHEADTTAVHGIPDTALLATDADVTGVSNALADHVGDTTGVHGIADTSQLLTSADLEQYATDADLAAHAADTTAVHGIPNTADLVTDADLAAYATDADVAAVQTNLDTHAADTTAVHGIPDTSQLATQADLTGFTPEAEFQGHINATTDVHGIPDTSALLTEFDLAAYATDAELAAHAADTTAVHGIPDTSVLETQAGAQAKADAAQTAAQNTAATALSAHAADTTAVHGIPDTSQLVTQADLGTYATDADVSAVQANLDAHANDTTAVHGIADTSVLETQAGAQTKANTAQTNATNTAATALAAHEADTTNIHGIANTAVLETQSGAQTKANAAQTAAQNTAATALASHEADTTNIHGIADTALLETQAGAQTKANAGRDAAIADAATKYLNRTTGGAITGNVTLTGSLTQDVATGATLAHGIRVTGDTNDRIAFNGDGSIAFGSGAGGADVHLRRTGTNLLQLDDNLAVVGTTALTGTATLSGLLQLMRASGTAVGLASQVTGDAFDSFRIGARGALEWGGGAATRDTFLQRETAGVLSTTDTIMRVYRGTSGGNAFSARVTGDTASRWFVNADGANWWGPGGAAGVDVGLFRSASGQLTVSGVLQTTRANATDAARDLRLNSGDTQPRFYQLVNGQMYWGPGGATALDTTLYRDQPGSLVTDTNFTVNGNLYIGGIGQRMFARRTSNLTRTNTATQTNDTQLTFTLAPNCVYEMHGLIVWGGSAPGDIIMDFAIPTGATGYWTTVQPSTSAAADPTSVRITANVVDQARTYGWFDNGSPNAAILSAVIITGASGGTYAFQWAQATADATGTTVYAGSFLSLERVA